MIEVRCPRLMIVGTGSGCGKTTLTCALLTAFWDRGLNPASFKCGPDYVDPLFHKRVIGTQSGNLDLYLCSSGTVRYLLGENGRGADICVIEGVMGMYDGMGAEDLYSSNHLALATKTPEVLVINTKGVSLSAAAEVYGYLHFKPNCLKGVILNNTSDRMYPFYKEIIEKETGLRVYGYLPALPEAAFQSRRLGLIPADEVEGIRDKLNILSNTCKKTVDVGGLIELARENDYLAYSDVFPKGAVNRFPVRIAVAQDRAFCFYYEDNLSLLRKLGAEIVPFSPLEDSRLPEKIDGLLFGGGYPEEHAEALAANVGMLDSIRKALARKIPVLAEGGGFIYLCRTLQDAHQKTHRMVGAVDARARLTERLVRFGYLELEALNDNLLLNKGDRIRGHEFHYSDTDNNGDGCRAHKKNGVHYTCIHTENTLFAGFPHLHLWGSIASAEKYIEQCRASRK